MAGKDIGAAEDFHSAITKKHSFEIRGKLMRRHMLHSAHIQLITQLQHTRFHDNLISAIIAAHCSIQYHRRSSTDFCRFRTPEAFIIWTSIFCGNQLHLCFLQHACRNFGNWILLKYTFGVKDFAPQGRSKCIANLLLMSHFFFDFLIHPWCCEMMNGNCPRCFFDFSGPKILRTQNIRCIDGHPR